MPAPMTKTLFLESVDWGIICRRFQPCWMQDMGSTNAPATILELNKNTLPAMANKCQYRLESSLVLDAVRVSTTHGGLNGVEIRPPYMAL